MKGIDISQWNGNLDFNKIKASGVEFAMIRAGFGGMVDPKFKQNIEGCIAAGIHVGIYWFIYSLNPAQAVNEANTCHSVIAPYRNKIDFPVACDFEYDSERYMRENGVTPTKALNTAIVKSFCDRIERLGWYTANYSNLDFIYNHFNQNELERFDLWVAAWGPSAPPRDCGIWQYTSDGSVPGSSARTDMNIAYKDYPSIINYVGTNTASVHPTTTAPSTAFVVGDKVRVLNPVTYNGQPFVPYFNVYDVIEANGDRIVIGKNGVVTAAVNAENLSKATVGSLNVGDNVRVLTAVTYDGQPFYTYYNTYGVIEVSGDRVVIGKGGVVTAAVNINNLQKI